MNRSLALFFLVLLGSLLGSVAAQAGTVDFTGHYELADAKSDWAFSLDVTQKGSTADVAFSAGMQDGSGAAPDGDGKGTIGKDGALTFKFKDSFDNEGTGTLIRGKDGYQVTMDATKVAEPRAMRFYGNLILKKTANKPASS